MKCIWTGCKEEGIVSIGIPSNKVCYCIHHAQETWKYQLDLLERAYQEDMDSLNYLYNKAINKAKGIKDD